MSLPLAAALAAAFLGADAPRVDPALPAYRPASSLSGTLAVGGSDTLDPVVQLWLTGFRNAHPNVQVRSSAQGSEAGFLCLLESTCGVATMSREMSKVEVAAFEAKHGHAPTRLVAAVGALAVFVHPSNPLGSISMEQLDAVFSMTRKAGGKEPITSWGQLGLSGDWAGRRVTPYGRDEHSGTRNFFKEKVLLKGDFRPSVNAMGDAQSQLEAVMLDATGIAYGSFNDVNSMVKVLPIVQPGGAATAPTIDAIMNGRYSLVRFFYIYVNRAAGKPLPPLVSSFVSYGLSKDGQTQVAAAGFIPIPADLAKSSLQRIQ
ncbi:MAG: substrate-binding domain-containing protein [Deltaproteobacteria bacterium]|nr:substrate-binding domain-containing protein [Deltaproteobacteria bacterium]